MANFTILFVVCAVVGCVFGIDKGIGFVPEPPIPNSSPGPITSTTTGPKTTTSATTPSPNTTTLAPTTTTLAPKTTTPAPNSTTPASTTTPIPPTPAPTPTPGQPDIANWTVYNENKTKICITLQIAAQYEFILLQVNKTVKLNVPKNATASGSCENSTKQNLTVSWDKNSLEFIFGMTNTSKYELEEISSVLSIGQDIYNLVHEKPEFSTPIANSYKCAREQTLNLTNSKVNTTDIYYLHVSHLQYQAFRNTTESKFDSALDCEGSITPDIVPIVVGCVLAVLVVMVLIAYLVGRRRCAARGYLSMFAETKREADYIPMKNLSCFN